MRTLTEIAPPAEAEAEAGDVSELLAAVAVAASELLAEDASTVTEEKPWICRVDRCIETGLS